MKKYEIGNVQLSSNIFVGPLAGISNEGFRGMIKTFNPGLIYTEMTSDKAIAYGSKRTLKMCEINEEERPISLQLFGHDIDTMVKAAMYMDQHSACDIIDINMGCPVPKVVNNKAGSYLMKDVGYAGELVREIVKNIEKPLTVKMRAGWDRDSINCLELAQEMERSGVSTVCLHPRTRTEYYKGHSDWSLIKLLKDNLHIPVIGNGDIKSVDDMIRMQQETGCDYIMVSRGVLGNPWLIQELVHYQETGERLEEVSFSDKIDQCLNHAQRLVVLKGEKVAIKEMRGHACWYINGMPHNNRIKAVINHITKYSELEELLQKYKEAIRKDDFSELFEEEE